MATTIPGGYYLGTDGKPHDAHGNPLPVAGDAPTVPSEDMTAVEAPVKPAVKPAKAGKP